MKTFTVTAPDGRTLKVQGNDAEGAAKAAEEYVRLNPIRGRPAADADARRRIANTPDQVRATTKGFTFGFADEIDAAGAALETGIGNLAKRATGQQPEYGMRDAFGAVMGANAEADAKFAREHPAQNIGLQIGGGLVGPGVAQAARFAGRATNLVGATMRGAAAGGVAGAVAGAGNAGGGVRERAEGAARGGVAGAVIGGAIPSVARAAQTGGRAINAAIGQPFGGANRGAVARLREALERDGLDARQIQATVQQWQRSGVTPEFLNVAGENTRALIRAASSQGGPARNAAQNYRNTTVASIPSRAIERANALTPGETRTATQFADEVRAARGVDARANYGAWGDRPVDVPEAVQDMLRDPSGRAIIARARADAVELGDWAQQAELEALLQPAQNGRLPRISAGTIDRLAIAARERGASFARSGRNARAAGSVGRRDQLNALLDDIPEVQPSRQQYARQSQAIEAAEGGPSVMGPRSEFEPAVQGLSQNPLAMQGAQIRERNALRDYFGQRDQVSARLGDISAAPDVRPNLNQLFGDRGDRFADAAGNLVQKQEHANFIAPNTGSQTQPRGQDSTEMFGTFRNIMEAFGGSLRPIVERLARGLTMTEAERNILVQFGIGTPDDAMRALAAPGPVARMAGQGGRRLAVAAPATAGASAGTAPR